MDTVRVSEFLFTESVHTTLAARETRRVPVAVQFTDPRLKATCDSAQAIDQAWGGAGDDVRTSLIVLAESPTFDAYTRLPNVTPEGDMTVFRGTAVAVVLALEPSGPPPRVVVQGIGVRELRRAG